jgi:hypothetical protein
MPHPCVPPFDTPKLVISKRNRPLETEKRRKKKGGPCHYSPFCLSPRLLYPRTALIGTCVGKGGGGGATFPTTTWTETSQVGPYLGNGGDDNPVPVFCICLAFSACPIRQLTVKHHRNETSTVRGPAFSINGVSTGPDKCILLLIEIASISIVRYFHIVYALRLPHAYGHVPGSIFLQGALPLYESRSRPAYVQP